MPGNHPDPFRSRSCISQQPLESDRHIISQEPFYLLCNVLRTAAMSWAQLLDFIREPEAKHTSYDGSQLEQLQQNKQFIEVAYRHFGEILRFINRQGNSNWPQCGAEELKKRVDDEAQSLHLDFSSLQDRARHISEQCSDSTNTILSITNIEEAQRAISQAYKLEQLTVLAFLFIPLNFISSCFGMNVQGLAETGPSLRVFFAIAIPFTAVFMVIPLWSRVIRSMNHAKIYFLSPPVFAKRQSHHPSS